MVIVNLFRHQAPAAVDVDDTTMNESNFSQEAEGVWSVLTIDADTAGHVQLMLSQQLQNDAALLEACKDDVEVLKKGGVFDADMNAEKGVCIFPNRCVIYKLSGDGVLVYSPSKLLAGMKEFLNEQGLPHMQYARLSHLSISIGTLCEPALFATLCRWSERYCGGSWVQPSSMEAPA